VFSTAAPPLPTAVDRFLHDGEPPIVFTLGSSAVGAAGSFYEESVRAAERIGRRAILLVGSDARNRPSRPLPSTMLAVEYAPHAALFPRASAVVHHGGIGTTAAALHAGRPMLVVPHAHDQSDNAFRAGRLGVARVLPATRYRADRVSAHLQALLTVPAYRVRAGAVAERLAKEDGGKTAADTIAAHAGRTFHIS
jgi:UDP:flavonoid glycosyltransferase YjiC (YdhE family)